MVSFTERFSRRAGQPRGRAAKPEDANVETKTKNQALRNTAQELTSMLRPPPKTNDHFVDQPGNPTEFVRVDVGSGLRSLGPQSATISFLFDNSQTIKISESGCWEWLNTKKMVRGYGFVTVKGKTALVHRLMWLIFRGNIPDDSFVCHSCDNPACINVNHLFLGSARDNYEDMVKKGRSWFQNRPRGEDSRSHKFSEAVIENIRTDHATGVAPKEILKKYKISRSHYRNVVLKQKRNVKASGYYE